MEVLRIVLLELYTLWTRGLVYVVIVEFFQKDLDFLLIILVDDDWCRFSCLLLFGLDLHILRNEGLGLDFLGDFDNLFLAMLERDVENGCVDVGSSLNKLQVDGIVEV